MHYHFCNKHVRTTDEITVWWKWVKIRYQDLTQTDNNKKLNNSMYKIVRWANITHFNTCDFVLDYIGLIYNLLCKKYCILPIFNEPVILPVFSAVSYSQNSVIKLFWTAVGFVVDATAKIILFMKIQLS